MTPNNDPENKRQNTSDGLEATPKPEKEKSSTRKKRDGKMGLIPADLVKEFVDEPRKRVFEATGVMVDTGTALRWGLCRKKLAGKVKAVIRAIQNAA